MGAATKALTAAACLYALLAVVLTAVIVLVAEHFDRMD
jgi:hypothetical protein